MKKEKTNSTDNIKQALLKILVVVSMSSIVMIVFFISKDDSGVVPPMPTGEIKESDIVDAVNQLDYRAKAIALDENEKILLKAFYTLNDKEAAAKPGDEKEVVTLMNDFGQKAQIGSTGNKDRYLLLGDFVAIQFVKAFKAVLHKAKKNNLTTLINSGDESISKLNKLGGGFLKNIISRNMIDAQGNWLNSRILPEILFRRRWRILANLPHRAGFLDVERIVDFNFLLVSMDKTLVDKKIRAIVKLKKINPSFDDVLAKSIVYYEGGQYKKAKNIVEKAHRTGRKDRSFLRFVKCFKN